METIKEIAGFLSRLNLQQFFVLVAWAVCSFFSFRLFVYYADKPNPANSPDLTVQERRKEIVADKTFGEIDYKAGISQLGKGISLDYIRKLHLVREATWSDYLKYLNESEGANKYDWGEVVKLKTDNVHIPFDALPSGVWCRSNYAAIDNFGEFGVVTFSEAELTEEQKKTAFEMHRIADSDRFLIAYTLAPIQKQLLEAGSVMELFVMNRMEADSGFLYPVVIPVGRLAGITIGPDQFGFLLKLLPGIPDDAK